MNLQRWIGRREADWKQFDGLLQQAERRGLKSLSPEQVRTLSGLYRSTAADLARSRTYEVGETLVNQLQALTARGYAQVYQGLRRQEWRAVRDFYLWELPATLRLHGPVIGLATLVFLVGGLIAWWYSWTDPAFINLIAPAELVRKVRDERELWMGAIVGIEPMAASNITTNNISVSFALVAGGITAGLYSLWILFYNGISIGAISALVTQNGLGYPFWAFVFPHGSLELPAIFIAGAAGLLLGRALVFPGRLGRADALKFYGVEAAKLVFGVVPMLIIAGTIEGFFSPSPVVPAPVKYITGTILFVLLLLYSFRKRPAAGKN